MDIAELLAFSVKNKASDLHLSAGLPPMIRVDGDVRRINERTQGALRDRRTRLHRQTRHHTRLVRGHRILHLHRLQHDDQITLRDLLTLGHRDLDDGALHRCGDSVTGGGSCACATALAGLGLTTNRAAGAGS